MLNEVAAKKAKLAAESWGGLDAPARMIRNRENAVFEVMLKSGQHAALRLHRMGYQTPAAIEAELVWTDKLRAEGFACPEPIKTQDGGWIAKLPDGQIATCVGWINATPIGENGVLFDGSVEAHCAQYRQVGALIAQLHQATARIDCAGLERPMWDLDGLLGEDPHWGRFWENPALDPDEARLLLQVRDAAREDLERRNLPLSLIHADLLQENIMQDKDGLWLIDFDDGGFGYHGYDLGTALIQHAELPYLDQLSDAMLSGYEAVLGPQPDLAEGMPLFIMLRGMASCGWTIARAAPDHPSHRAYAERALRCATTYLQTTTAISS
ncbi:phosphotransferase enzyme family protein [Litoreibacter arenae]|uniref:Homoserine kinase n=1 Tax=Litoreibacter arenae DSM 19593 TaxID=1123360 RepID=S9RTM7_9RHOB|nr:phosphotransferase [Litoreibacter arenae]EPX77314.1 Homoserine kinase [Litoreibacter arenae DSM 19593]